MPHRRARTKWIALGLMLLALAPAARIGRSAQPSIAGDLKKWHPITISFRGPAADELDKDANPFLDCRLTVKFTGPAGKTYAVPGFFDGDGSGGGSGDVWRVRFTPDEAGQWSWEVSFRRGPAVALSFDPAAGQSAAFDGQKGALTVGDRDPNAPGFLKQGCLEYAGGHYLKFRGGGYWIKGGTDSPEDLLAYAGFDNTRSGSQFAVTDYKNHVNDWKAGDPDWGDGKGKALIGALNYLASRNVNLIYFLPMNIGGDGKNVWPFAGNINPAGHPANDNLHYDLGKLRQWEIVFAHAQRKGIVLHFVLNEAEKANKEELGGLDLTPERKLFYREMVARFGHHNALLWNLCEEYNIGLDLGVESVKAFAAYLQETDPYDHPITVHHAKNPVDAWKPFIGNPLFSITSLQIGNKDIEPVVETLRELTAKAGRPLPVAVDEFTVTTQGSAAIPTNDFVALRREEIWPAYLSGGQVEIILGELLDTQNFHKYEDLWNHLWHARKFLEEHAPFWEMAPADDLLDGESVYKGRIVNHDGQVFAKPGVVYALYLPLAKKTGTLDLSGAGGGFEQRWYDPRTGEFAGPARVVKGGGKVELGSPPHSPGEDWAVLVKQTGKN